MSSAFKCDSCGNYSDGKATVIVVHPDSEYGKPIEYELCPSCFNEVVNVVVKDNDHGDID